MKLSREQLTPSIVKELLSYDPESGIITWLPRKPQHFFDGGKHSREGKAISWNGRFAGKEAFLPRNASGYLHGTVMTVTVQAHRVAWCLHCGEWPSGIVDHINGDPADNRIANLRLVDNLGNSRNAARSKLNTSGATGVVWHKRARKWQATIRTGDGRRKFLGYFDTIKEAAEARKQADKVYGYHPNHGRESASAA